MISGDSSAALLGLAAMMMFAKRGSAVLDAPEESLALTPDRTASEWIAPEPAPAGTLYQGPDSDAMLQASHRNPETEPWPGQNVPSRYRLRVGVPSTVVGRVALGTGLVFVLCLLSAAVFAARYSVLHDDRFVMPAPAGLEIEGTRHLTRPQIAEVFSKDLERNVFRVPLAERQADLERLPWVEHATVMRLLPDRIRVQVEERTPVAFVRQGAQIGLVDASGVLLDMPQDVAGDPLYSFPVLTGISAADPLSTRAARMVIYSRFVHDLDSSGEKLTQSLSEVDVSDPEDVKALIASGGTDILVHFGDEDFLQRYRLFEQNLPQWKQQYPKLAAVDTRYEHQLVLEMTPGTPAPLAEAASASGTATKAIAKDNAKHPVAKLVASTQHKPVSVPKPPVHAAHAPVKP